MIQTLSAYAAGSGWPVKKLNSLAGLQDFLGSCDAAPGLVLMEMALLDIVSGRWGMPPPDLKFGDQWTAWEFILLSDATAPPPLMAARLGAARRLRIKAIVHTTALFDELEQAIAV